MIRLAPPERTEAQLDALAKSGVRRFAVPAQRQIQERQTERLRRELGQ